MEIILENLYVDLAAQRVKGDMSRCAVFATFLKSVQFCYLRL